MLPSEYASALAPGTVISDKYRVERVLGKGGMGVVVAARHLDLNQVLAIKVLLATAANTDEATARFLREGRAAAQLTSPHVTKVHDTGRLASGEPYLVMEFLRGRDLRAHLAEVKRVSLPQATEWVLQAAHALAEAHRLNIIHRDVKPGNLFLAETSAGLSIKVLDFGISKQLDSADGDLTTTASTIGTPRYMAPEQMRSAKFVDGRGDIWSLGIVLYELTTGQAPFQGDTVTALCFDVMERTPTPPSQLNPDLPRAFDDVIARALEKNPDERFQSMEALATALRAVTPGSQQRFSGVFDPVAVQPEVSVASTPMPALPPPDPTGPRRDVGRVPLPPVSSPGSAGPPSVPNPPPSAPGAELAPQPDQQTMQAWDTTAWPRGAAKKQQRNRNIALLVGLGVAATTLVTLVLVMITGTHGPSAAAGDAAPTATPTPQQSPPPVATSGPHLDLNPSLPPTAPPSETASAAQSVHKTTAPPTATPTHSLAPTATPAPPAVSPPPHIDCTGNNAFIETKRADGSIKYVPKPGCQ